MSRVKNLDKFCSSEFSSCFLQLELVELHTFFDVCLSLLGLMLSSNQYYPFYHSLPALPQQTPN